MDIAQLFKSAFSAYDNSRERSQQEELGVSSILGCSRAAWYIVNKQPVTNHDTEKVSAIMGTAIHEAIAKGLALINPFDDLVIESEYATEDIKGHTDLYIKSEEMVVDWKTITLAKIKNSKWVDRQKNMQIQVYGYLLEEHGIPVKKVALGGIPRDGWRWSDFVDYIVPYDRNIALEGINWVRDIKQMDTPPEPEETPFFCKNFCGFYDESGEMGCKGKLSAKR